ncbi:XdhC family protein [Chlorogloea sp. CCALA 695]|uniref:XdhC family protein n=1 Tax=Chlorogloea sp. CCALA 695 TaxID=2107693 RepID=UPI000D05D7EC|nr:XdhC/CoxI family protein [Chlorogloea sp. CCALA 695]PSB26564.1 xanthine dehydrogenase [Chlorogloea sp. CCALA 695]
MKEFIAILAELEKSNRQGKTTVLTTVIEAQGSTYRRAGARMLLTSDGCSVGTISGGCLEADVALRSQKVMASKQPTVVTYDTTSDEDIVWGLGLGCDGLVRVLIEPITPKQTDYVEFLSRCYGDRQLGVVATLVSVTGPVQEKVGTRLMLQQNGSFISHFSPSVAASIVEDARAALERKLSSLKSYQLPIGEVEVFIEVIQPPLSLLIFGAGHDALPVARFAKELGWNVTVVDTRQSTATQNRFTDADAIVLSCPEDITDHISVGDLTVAVVMTHNYLHDLELLKILLPSQVCYLGILGPKSRTERLLEELRQIGTQPTKEQIHRLYAPIGLDIGADTPEEIALSIIAGIQAVITNRLGNQLRERKGSIHEQVSKQGIQSNPSAKRYVSV